MPAISSLVTRLARSYPALTFRRGQTARWSPDEQTVYYAAREPEAAAVLLHETAHALLTHQRYTRDIELLQIERAAWDYARETLAPQFGVAIDAAFAEQQLDTYRDWLHSKSTCPTCQSNGYEQRKHQYHCPHCQTDWHTNTGIDVGVRRTVASTK